MSDANNNKKSIEVAAGLIFKDGKLLITRRKKEDYLGGLWEFPGGKRNVNETFEDCLKRELMEELGIEVSVGELLWSMTHNYPEFQVHLRFLFCSLIKGEPKPIGCDSIQWISREQLCDYQFPEADALLVDLLNSLPQLWEKAAR
ncbi:MAG: 8-oxo-dGTP diphosphatase MutT [Verrucomicrobiia bacterium]